MLYRVTSSKNKLTSILHIAVLQSMLTHIIQGVPEKNGTKFTAPQFCSSHQNVENGIAYMTMAKYSNLIFFVSQLASELLKNNVNLNILTR